jgi:hypothetical protein
MVRKVNIDLDHIEDCSIIGISCHKIDYWIARQLNEALNLNLTREIDLPVFQSKEETTIEFPFFNFIKPDDQTSFSLLSNYNPEGKLFPDQKSFDYFIVIKGRVNDDLLSKWVSEIKKIPQVLIAHILNLKKIKNLQGFLFDLELHLIKITGRKKKRII